MESITNTRNDLVSKRFGNWQLDLVDNVLIGSARYKANFGRGADESFTYEMFWASVHPEDCARLEETFRNAIEQVSDYETDYRCIWPDGSLHWINAWGLVIADKGKATRMIGFTLDITGRKQAEDDLRRNRDTFYNLVANSPLGVYVVDSEFRLREVSAGCRQIFSGVQPLIGRDFAEVLRIVWTEPFATQAIALFRNTLETGESYHSPETTEQRRDVMEVQSYDWQIERMTLPDGKCGVVCYFFDMTERVRSQRLLAEQKRLLEMVVSNSSLGKCLDDLTESITRLHPAVCAGVLTSDSDGTRVGDVYAARFPPAFTEAMRGAPLDRILFDIRKGIPAATPDGSRRNQWASRWLKLCLRQNIRTVHSTPIFSVDGKLVALFILTLGEERMPNEWELRIASFGAHIASVALERDRFMKALYEHRQHLADDLDTMTRLQAISTQLVQGNDMQALLRAILAAAVDLTGTDRGNVWLCNTHTGKLGLEMHQGFGPRFLEHFRNTLPIVCEVTAGKMERTIWEDVAADPILRGTRDLQVLLEEGVRSVQCTPLVSRDGRRLLGLLNTHFRIPKKPTEQELRSIDLLARMAADSIERHFAEAALRESQQRYRTLFESIDEGFCIIQLIFDEHEKPVDFRFMQINPAFERETGLKGALGKTMREMVPNLDQPMVEIYGRVALSHEAVRFEDYSEALQRWFSIFAFPIADHGSRQVGLLFSDVTERKRAEQAIQHHSEEIESLLDAAPLAVYLVDSDLRIRELNPIAKSIFGDVPGGVIGRNIVEIIHHFLDKNNADDLVSIFRHTLETGEPYETQERAMIGKDGKITGYYEGRLNRITLPDDRHGIVCYFRNISPQVQVRKEIELSRDMLREIDRRKDEFLAMLAHELRNPLAPILNASQVLRHASTDSRAIAAAGAVVQRQVSQMVRLVDDLLDVSRITRGKIELRKERVELKSVVKLAVEAVRPLCKSLEHKLKVTLPPQPVYLNVDPARLTQVIGNLLNNSCKFTRHGGRIKLMASVVDDHVIIRVRDNGVGIAKDQLSRIFDMFTQVDQSLERPQGGLGIGLTLVKSLVEMHDGTVEAHSEGMGKGSEFVVCLPIMDGEPAEVHAKAQPCQTAAVSRRILLVDDNRDLTESLAMLLQMTGHEVHVAADGLEGVDAAAEFKPDVVLLDIGLPKLNGYETARRIRKQQSDKPAFLVAMTGWGQEEDRRRSREAGFNAHIVKPVDPDTLTRLLAGLDPAGPGGLSMDNPRLH